MKMFLTIFHTATFLMLLCRVVNSAESITGQCVQDEQLIRNTTSGSVRGEIRSNELDPKENYYAFHAIPYGAPPTGTNRFKPPRSPEHWENVFDASDPNNYKCCPQPELKDHDLKMNEDCLLLSVYTPLTTEGENDLLPVVVWIHGGAFITSCGSYPMHGPNKIMQGNDVVMVSINYRLGNLGFLSLGENELPGNMGLRDQTFALEWVQSNIEQFSGDSNKITIMGESAGSWSVFYHMMSPRSTNLFQQVIGQSGTVVSPNWREYTAEEAKRWGQSCAEDLGCDQTEGVSAQITCLQELPVDDIANSNIIVGFRGAQAVVDGSFSDEPFLPDHPKILMSSGMYNMDVNILLGNNRDEGLLTTVGVIQNHTILEDWKTNWYEGFGASALFGIEYMTQTEEMELAVEKLTNFYLGKLDNMNIQHINSLTQMLTDSNFAYGVHDFITRHLPNVENNTILQYLYTHEGAHSLVMENVLPTVSEAPYGVCHGDETFLQFQPYYIDYIEEGLNKADSSVSRTLLELWKNFVKTGKASTDELIWNPIHETETGELSRKYLRLTYAESSYMEFPDAWKKRMQIWDEVMNDLQKIGTV